MPLAARTFTPRGFVASGERPITWAALGYEASSDESSARGGSRGAAKVASDAIVTIAARALENVGGEHTAQ